MAVITLHFIALNIFSALCFMATIAVILGVFYFNKVTLLNIIANSGKAKENRFLTFLDKFKYLTFFIGFIQTVVMLVWVGCSLFIG